MQDEFPSELCKIASSLHAKGWQLHWDVNPAEENLYLYDVVYIPKTDIHSRDCSPYLSVPCCEDWFQRMEPAFLRCAYVHINKRKYDLRFEQAKHQQCNTLSCTITNLDKPALHVHVHM